VEGVRVYAPQMTRSRSVVLLHGIDDTTRLFSRLGPFLEERGWTVHAWNLVPNDGSAGIDALARQVQVRIDDALGRDEIFDLLGFSMGGIVARYYLQRLGGLARVERLVTISSPHRGTWMAYFRRNTGARQMRPRSMFLRDLDQDRADLARLKFTSIWTPLDLMILPAASSVIPEAKSIGVSVLAHPLMVRDGRVLQLVAEALSSDAS
jgi:triacylglycerol lipase